MCAGRGYPMAVSKDRSSKPIVPIEIANFALKHDISEAVAMAIWKNAKSPAGAEIAVLKMRGF